MTELDLAKLALRGSGGVRGVLLLGGFRSWEQLNALFLRLKQARTEGTWSSRPHYICRMAIEGVHLFAGVTDATMSYGEGWQYLQAGRYLERAGATAALVDLYFREDVRLPPTHAGWAGLLRSCAAVEA